MVTANSSLNGAGSPQERELLELIASYAPAELHRRITIRETALKPMMDRFDKDFDLWRQTPFTGIDNEIYDSENFLHYTSNEPRTFANKVTNWFNNASMIIRIEQEGRNEQLRRIDSAKERLAYGLLEAADRRLKRMGQAPVRGASGFQICIRGPVFARTMLRIDPKTGQTIIDITPWDSRNVVWDYGPEGLAWVAYKMRKTRDQIRREYGVRLEGSSDSFNAGDQHGIVVYDFYDDIVNAVFTEDLQVLKPPQPHLRPRMPVSYAFGGDAPLLSNDTNSNEIREFSESIYEANREVYKWDNYLRSVNLHLAAEARDPVKKIFSPDGGLSLDADANTPGAEVPLRTNQEDIERMPPVELTNTAVNMQALVQAQVQQGSLSPVHFGNSPFSLSGYAINSLGISAEEKIQPRIRQGEDFYLMTLEILMEQYATGMFPVLTVSGRDRSGAGFNEQIPPQVVQIGGELTIELIPNLPEDDAAKIQTALLLRQPGVNGMPLVDDKWIRDKKLAIKDADNMEDRLRGQIAETGSPMARLYSNIQAAMNQGDMALAQIYFQDMQFLLFQMWAATQGMIVPQVPQIGGPEYGSPQSNMQQTNVSPQARPAQSNGIRNAPTQQAGANVPAGTPRPGAQRTQAEQTTGQNLR